MRKYYLLLGLFVVSSILFAEEESTVDRSKCTAIRARFLVNGNEVTVNQEIRYFDEQGRLVLSVLLDTDGSERMRKQYIYDEDGREKAFIVWVPSSQGKWRKDMEKKVITSKEGEYTIRTEITIRYYAITHEDITRITKLNSEGKIVEEEWDEIDGSKGRAEYDEYGNIVYKEYENEKTEGLVKEWYSYTYADNKGTITSKETRDQEGRVLETLSYTYGNDGKLVQLEIKDHRDGSTSSIRYIRDSEGKIIRIEYTDPFGEITHVTTYEYDARGRVTSMKQTSKEGSTYEWRYEIIHEAPNTPLIIYPFLNIQPSSFF